jgi:hypothetical protein
VCSLTGISIFRAGSKRLYRSRCGLQDERKVGAENAKFTALLRVQNPIGNPASLFAGNRFP